MTKVTATQLADRTWGITIGSATWYAQNAMDLDDQIADLEAQIKINGGAGIDLTIVRPHLTAAIAARRANA